MSYELAIYLNRICQRIICFLFHKHVLYSKNTLMQNNYKLPLIGFRVKTIITKKKKNNTFGGRSQIYLFSLIQ